MKNIILSVFIIVFISFSGIALSCASDQPSGPVVIRVCIIDDRDEIRIGLKGKYKIYAMNSKRVIMEGPFLNGIVKVIKEGLKVGDRDIKNYGIEIKVARDANIYVDAKRFRGAIDIIKKDNGKMMVVNHLDLENYLYGVLYHEVSHRWPLEALKAQAIVARTFAIYQAAQNKSQPYDLRSDTYSQVYGGRTSEKWSTTRAVNLTKNKILVYNGQIFPSYYHATCAGQTEDASNLWNVDMAPLKGVPCGFCKNSPHYYWKKEIPLWKIENKLREGGYKIGKIASVEVLSRNKSGRVDKIQIKDDLGVSVILTGKDFRQLIGPNEVRSTRFEMLIRWGNLVVQGSGWGHGVGMCQWGVYGMSKKGKSAEEILKYYYPGTEITTLDKAL